MQGRITRPEYRTSMNVCLNGLPVEQGAWTRRPGTRFAAATRAGAAGRVMPFAFQQNAPYTLEFTDGFLRAYSGTSLAMTNDPATVISISTDNPAVVTLSVNNDWATGDTVMFNTLGAHDSLLENRQFSWTTTDALCLIPAGTGTIIGSFDTRQSAAFDGVTAQAVASSAQFTGTVTADAYLGKDWGSGNSYTVTKVKVIAPSDQAIYNTGNSTIVTIFVEESNDNSTWTSIGASVFASNVLHQGQVLSINTSSATAKRYHRVRLTGNGSNSRSIAEVQFFINAGTITDAITGDDIDGSTLATFTSGNLTRVMELTTSYAGGSWSNNRLVQAEDNAVILNGGVAPHILSVTQSPQPGSFAEFSLDAAVFKDGPYLDPFTNGVLATPSAKKGIVNLTFSFAAYDSSKAYAIGDYVSSSSISYRSLTDQNVGNTPSSSTDNWVSVPATEAISAAGLVGTDIGRHVRLFSEPPIWVFGTAYVSGNVVKFNNQYWQAIQSNTSSPPGLNVSNWVIFPTGAIWTWGRITTVVNQISQTLSGVANIGDMTDHGGLSAAFDGNSSQSNTACASHIFVSSGANANFLTEGYVGRDFTGASAQQISSVTAFPSTNFGFVREAADDGHVLIKSMSFNLMASQTEPQSHNDGTLLGTISYPNDILSTVAPITINSKDTATAWNYVWLDIVGAFDVDTTHFDIEMFVGELQFFSPPSSTEGSAVSVEILGPDLLYTTSISTWRMGIYSDTLGWPTCGTYHEGRLWLSGSVPNRLDASVPNDIFNFAPTEQDGTVTDASAIDYTLAAPDVNSVLWMQPDQQGIIVGTEAGEWLVQASALNSPLTPTNMQAHRVTRIGCANILPMRTEHTIVFVHRYKRKVMEYFADIFSGKFSAPDIAEAAKHLANRGIEELAYQQELSPVIWARCSDGSLIGCSYKRVSLMSSQGPTFAGWHPHQLGSSRTVESICSGPSTDGARDTLAMVTTDSSNVRHVEFLTDLWQEGGDLTNAWYLDDAVVPTYTQDIVLGGVSSFQMFGLWHLNGETVSVFAGGLDLGEHLVTDGACSVAYGANALFTTDFVSSFGGNMPVVVGYSYTSKGQIVRPATPAESGARSGPAAGKKRRVQYATALMYDSQDVSFGTKLTEARLNKATLTTEGETKLAANVLFSGVFRSTLTDDYSFDGMICWQGTRMFPINIANIGGFLQTQDS